MDCLRGVEQLCCCCSRWHGWVLCYENEVPFASSARACFGGLVRVARFCGSEIEAMSREGSSHADSSHGCLCC
jgi:hypothetical protein